MTVITQPLPNVAAVGTPEGRQALRERGLRPVLIAEGLLEQLADVDWGDPDADGWYTPVLRQSRSEPTERDR